MLLKQVKKNQIGLRLLDLEDNLTTHRKKTRLEQIKVVKKWTIYMLK